MERSVPNAAHSLPAPSAVLELLKPITWFPPMWAFGCGVVSAGTPAEGRWGVIAAGIALAGPLVCATSQAVNDWFDRHVDAINEPNRPIPSGRIPGRWGLWIAIVWTLLSALVAMSLGPVVTVAAVCGIALAWAYSAPPFRLKRNGWWGNSAVAACYEGLPWITGASVMLGGALPSPEILVIAALYSIGAHGIMTLNDFKSVEGDLRMGIGSLPAKLGVEGAGRAACLFMALPQVVVAGLLLGWGHPWHAAIIAASLVTQLALMVRLLRSPRELAPWYNGTGVTLYVLGMLVTAFALRAPVVSS
jgi:chlorophyll/bacteriochlorophyll a synthase